MRVRAGGLGPSFVQRSATVIVNFGTKRQIIDGFGAASSGVGLDTTRADLFFTTIGLSLFRLTFSSNSGGITPYYPENADMASFWNAAQLAGDRGALLWAAPWTANDPTWKDNGSWVSGNLNAGHYADWAAVLAGFQADLHTQTGYNLYAMSVGNEPDFTATYESMLWSAVNMSTFIKNNLGPSLRALNPAPLLIAPECENWDNSVTYLSTLLTDNTTASYLDVVATHQYEGTVVPLKTTKKVWETEMSDISATFDGSMANGLTVAAQIHTALTVAQVNAWHAWWARNPQQNNLALIGGSVTPGDDVITKRVYVVGQWAKFVRPGMYRVSITGSAGNASLTGFINSGTGAFAIVAINATASSQPIVFSCGKLAVSVITPYITDATRDLAAQSTITPTNDVFSYTLPANSVTTFSGTGS